MDNKLIQYARDNNVFKLLNHKDFKLINSLNSNNETAYMIALKRNNIMAALILLSHGADPYMENTQELINYSKFNSKSLLEYYIKRKANVNGVDFRKNTPLIYACMNQIYTNVKILIDNGADVNQQGSNGITPLMIARQLNNKEIIDLLVDNEANPFIYDNFRRNAFNYGQYYN